MSNDKINIKQMCAVALLAATLCSIPLTLIAYKASDFNWRPPFSFANEKPSVSIILDTSNAMHRMAYAYIDSKKEPVPPGETDFRKSGVIFDKSSFYGYFNPNANYKYANTTRPGDTKDSGYFYIPEDGNGDWNGTFMNWATMHRIDVIRKILTGGKFSNNTIENDSTSQNSTHIFFEVETTDSPSGSNSTDIKFNTREIDAGKNSTLMTPYAGQVILAQHPLTDYLYVYNSSNLPNTDGKAAKPLGGPFQLRIAQAGIKPSEQGVLDFFVEEDGSTKARFALFQFHPVSHKGAKILTDMSDNPGTMREIKHSINTLMPNGPSPVAEALYTITGYLQQHSARSLSGPKFENDSYDTTDYKKDPYYFSKYNSTVSCTEQNVLLITPGEIRQDGSLPQTIKDYYPNLTKTQQEAFGLADLKALELLDIAYYGHKGFPDLRTEETMSGNQHFNLYTVAAFGKGNDLLKYGAIYGGFEDKDNNNLPGDGSKPAEDPASGLSASGIKIPNSDEYKPAEQILPNQYYEGDTGEEIKDAIMQALLDATRGKQSGTAAAVTSQTRSGEGAVYQALFFPPSNATGADLVGAPWSGQLHAFLVDSKGNMREDTNHNFKLDPDEDNGTTYVDRVIRFTDDGQAIVNSTTTSNSTRSTEDLNYLWSSTPWLNSASATQQRVSYNPGYATNSRYIMTFLDKSGNMTNTTPNEYIGFTTSNVDKIKPYLTLYNSYEDTPDIIKNLSKDARDTLCDELAPRQINFIRGESIENNKTASGYIDTVRQRKDKNNITWKLGDIVYSSPTVVGAPSENYHILYADSTYKKFYQTYKNRRQMIYVGANDGMLHAFNGGFYNSDIDSDNRGFKNSTSKGETQFPLGMELWAYVPYNLLPHLRWLMDSEYGSAIHVPYMDLKPRVFDARVFDNSTHPDGWGTILVAGMRFGGGRIQVDSDRNQNSLSDPVMSSAYVIMDITNPEEEPILLGEITMPELGFTTCYPTVMPMSTPNTNITDNSNNWFLVFGSGPADQNGWASTSPTDYRNPAISAQSGRVYILDLKHLVQQKQVRMMTPDGNFASNSAFATTEPASFIGDPVATDLDFGSKTSGELKTDIVYYGTVSGDETHPSGTMRRILTYNKHDQFSSWIGNSTLFTANLPITASPNLAMDEEKNLWVYFGAGRFYNRGDIGQAYRMSFFGVKDPIYNSSSESISHTLPNSIHSTDLFDSTKIELTNGTCPPDAFDSNCIDVFNSSTHVTGGWTTLLNTVALTSGWHHDFIDINPPYYDWERVLGQPAVFGGTVLFTSYSPNEDICIPEGESRLYALYYKTGTAYFEPILSPAFDKYHSLGAGLAITPSIHIGEKGATAYVQTSTGAIKTIEINPPINVNPGVLFWRKNTN